MVLDNNKKLHEKYHVIHTILHIFWSATTMYLLICPLFIKIFEASHWPLDHLISSRPLIALYAKRWDCLARQATEQKMYFLELVLKFAH